MAVLFAMAAIWGIGALARVPQRVRLAACGLLILAVILGHLLLPDGNALRVATGGSAAPWALLLAAVVLIGIYRRGLAALRARALNRGAESPTDAGPSDAELRRYSRQMMLREIGGPGQMKLRDARVLVIGAGGLGSPVLLYLAAAGIGTLGVIDDDDVDSSNLQRQVLHRDDAIGTPKVFSAQKTLEALNPYISVRPYHRRFSSEIATDLLAEYDLVIDGCDSFDTRAAVNAACVTTGTPLISGAISQWEGQVSLFDPSQGAPCYACVFPKAPAAGLAPTCAEAGVLGPLPGIIGTIMAAEAVKHLTGAGETLAGRMLIYDALYADTRVVTVSRNPACPVCG